MTFWGLEIMESLRSGWASTSQGWVHLHWGWVGFGGRNPGDEQQREFLRQGAVPGLCLWIFLGVPPSGYLLSVALVLSNGIEALLQV